MSVWDPGTSFLKIPSVSKGSNGGRWEGNTRFRRIHSMLIWVPWGMFILLQKSVVRKAWEFGMARPGFWHLCFLPSLSLNLCLCVCLLYLSYLVLKRLDYLPGAPCFPPAFRSCFVSITQHSNDLLMNLWGRKWSLHPTPPLSWPPSPTPPSLV